MWWSDIKYIKTDMEGLKRGLLRIEAAICEMKYNSTSDHIESIVENLKDHIDNIFCSDDEYNSINRIHDKLNHLVEDASRKNAVLLAAKTLDGEAKKLDLSEIGREIYQNILSCINSDEKLTSICENEEKKSPKQRKTVRKKTQVS